MSYGGYNPYSNNGGGRGYNSNPFGDENASGYGTGAHEMASFGEQGYGAGGRPTPSSPPVNEPSILDECKDIQNQVQDIRNKLEMLPGLQKRYNDDPDMSGDSKAKRDLDAFTQAIMDQYRALTDRVRQIKRNPECRHPRNVAQVNKTDRDLQGAIQKFLQLESASREEMTARVKREARIVGATEEEIDRMVKSDTQDTQVFMQAVMGNRTDQATRVLGAVRQRHQEMLQIEKSLMELLDLLNDMQELLTKQEVTVMEISSHAEDTAKNLSQSNVQLEGAYTSARKSRKLKWICLGICVLIVVIIVVAVVAYIMINRASNGGGGGGNNNGSGKRRSLFQRNVMDELHMNTARALEISTGPAPAHHVARSFDADVSPALRLPRQRFNIVRRAGAMPNSKVEASIKRRFVVDWDGPDATGSDD